MKFIHENRIIPLSVADTVRNTRIESATRTVGIDGSSDLFADRRFGNTVNIDRRAVDAADHAQLAFGDLLNLYDIVLSDNTLPDIYAKLYHVLYDRLADTVCMVHVDHATFMDHRGNLCLERLDQLTPYCRW